MHAQIWADCSDCGLGILAAGLLLRLLASRPSLTWLWMPGAGLLAAGSALFLWARMGKSAPVVPMPNARTAVGTDTARLLDNFEQRFAELKGRKPNATVLQDLYTLATSWSSAAASRRPPPSTGTWRASTTPTATSPHACGA